MTASPRDLAQLLPALRQYRHNHGDGFVFGYDKEETDRIVSGLIEDRNQQYAMKCKAREQRDKSAAMLRELANATLDIIAISDRKHDAWDAAKAVIEKSKGLANPVQGFGKDAKTSALVWSSEHEANQSIRYNHVLADSPLGQFSIEWKGWKDHDAYCVYLDGDYLDSDNDLDEAKLIAEKRLADKSHELFEFCSKERSHD